ncbi:hypothetical protein [Sphaerisporangium aureirubrum]|uniref:Cytochrome P450 n=1 Tax=Sphaerisporangium aureirubrum TaxID=1544736 RepID=A0ABW1NLM1_9ACTN
MAHVEHAGNCARAGRAVFLPREFIVHDETAMRSEASRHFAPYAPSVQDAVFVPANQAARLPGGLEPLTLSRLMLPYFEGATPETLIKLRESESEAFSRFAYWMRAKLKEFDGAPSEAAIRDIVAELDYGVAELAVEARKLSRGRLLNGVHVGFFSISIAVVAMNPDPLTQQIAGMVGSVTLLDLVREIVASRDARDDLRKSEFFVPYLIKRPDGLGRVRR